MTPTRRPRRPTLDPAAYRHGEILTVGVLALVRDRLGRPQLDLTIACPWCGRMHTHGWGLDTDGNPARRQPHCSGRRGVREGLVTEYSIAPAESPHNVAVLAQHRAALEAHQRRDSRRA